MFGFLNPTPHTNGYRRAYARLCLHQRQNYGLASLAFHSFEAVFLYQLACDAGAVPATCLPNVRCCKLSRKENVTRAADGEVGRYCSSVAMLLASVKLNDDAADSGSWLARGVRFVLRGRLARATGVIARLDPTAAATVSGFLKQHAALEQRHEPVALGDYVEPTGAAFGYVFGLAARLPGLSRCGDVLATVGRHVGAAIIAYDCAVDWERDRRRGEYNPLRDREAVTAALHHSAEELAAAAELCRRYFGHESRAAATLVRVSERVLQRATSGVVRAPARAAWSQPWAFVRRAVTGSPMVQMALAGVFASAGGVGGDGGAVPPGGPGGFRKGNTQGKQDSQPQGSGGGSGTCVSGDCGGGDAGCCDGGGDCCSGCGDCGGGCDCGGC